MGRATTNPLGKLTEEKATRSFMLRQLIDNRSNKN